MLVCKLGVVVLTLLLTMAWPPSEAAAYEPRETPVGEAGGAHPCGINRDGSIVVVSDPNGEGWAQWTVASGLTQIGGLVSNTSDVQVSDDGRYLTQWHWDITIARITQFDSATGTTVEVSGLHSIVTRPAVSPSGDRISWLELRRGQVGSPTFIGIRQWNRTSQQVTTVLDFTADGWDGFAAGLPSSNGRFLSIGNLTDLDALEVLDTTSRSRITVQRPNDVRSPRVSLLGISDDGQRFLWLDAASRGDRWTVSDRTGAVLSQVDLSHTMSFQDDVAQFVRGEYHFAADGSEVVAIGARPSPVPRGEPIAYRWPVGGALEVVETSRVVSGIRMSSPSPRLSSSWCAVSADLRYAVVVDPLISPPSAIRRADLDSVAPRQIDPSEVIGAQLSDQLTRLYSAFFERVSDADGLRFWMRERANGMSLASVAEQFARSDEFIDTFGPLDDEAFVIQVYKNVLDRAPDAEGLTFWLDQLKAGTTRGSLMVGFSESPEYIDQTATTTPAFDSRVASVSRLYRAFFDRPGDAGGLSFWFDEIAADRADLSHIASGFVLSNEFVALYGHVDDDAFVDLVYRNVLGRVPDGDGRAFWIDQLAAGRSRGDMMIGFSESPEYVVATNTLPPTG